MPAEKDDTAWVPTEGDHADDQTYERQHRNPTATPTDEERTQADIEAAEERNKEEEKAREVANKAAGK